MKTAALVVVAYIGAVLAFSASGFLANWIYQISGCIWTSSGVFGVTFLAFVSGFATFVVNFFDLADWFN
jgi:hypothetical protein